MSSNPTAINPNMQPTVNRLSNECRAHSDEDPFQLIDSAWGTIERWRANALETGSLGALTALSKKVRNNSVGVIARHDAREAALSARADALDQRERNLEVMAAQVADFVGKASVLFDRLHKIRDDAVAAAEGPLPSPPGTEEPKSAEPEPPLELEDAHIAPAVGKDPHDLRGEFLRLSHPVTRDEEEFPDPQLPRPPDQPQPISPGLDEK